MDFQTYERELQAPYVYNPIDISIGFYALCSYQPQAWEIVFQSIRQHYPDAPIVLINDGMEQYDYSSMATKYNCIYLRKVWQITLLFQDLSYVQEFMHRTHESCELVKTEWIIQLHPDVICQNKISYMPRANLCGVAAGSNTGTSGNNWSNSPEWNTVATYIRNRKNQPDVELNGWGWCGGSIMKVDSFYKVYDSIYKDKIFSLESMKDNMNISVFKHEDTLMPVLFAMNGFGYRIWKDNPEYHRNNVTKQGAFLHGYKEHYNRNDFINYVKQMDEVDKLIIERENYTTCATTKYGKILYNKNEDGIGSVLCNGIHWDGDTIEMKLLPFIKESKIILDIGAHIGCHTIAYSRINPECTIHAFEMQSEMFYYLEKNIMNNEISNVKLYNNAVGNQSGEYETEVKLRDCGYYKPIKYFSEDKFNFGGLGLGFGGEKVKMIKIDDLNLEECNFIKIDVEGFEYGVLLGALETINKYKPIIFYEYADKFMTPEMCKIAKILYHDNYNPKDLLIQLGYNDFDESIKGNVIARTK